MQRIYNILLGTLLSFGKLVFLWLPAHWLLGMPALNSTNLAFLFWLVLATWCFAGIFRLPIPLLRQAALHGVATYLCYAVLLHCFYQTAVFSLAFFLSTLLFAFLYLLLFLLLHLCLHQLRLDLNNLPETLLRIQLLWQGERW